jgi:acetyltransferase-like isoleucine patch superfamily enzyme
MLRQGAFHPSAVLADLVKTAEGVFVGPYAVVGFPDTQEGLEFAELLLATHETELGERVQIHSHSFVGQGCAIGANTLIESHSYVGSMTVIGSNCEIEYGARIYRCVQIGNGTSIGGFVCNEALIGARCNVQGKLVHARRVPGKEAAPRIHDDAFVGTDSLVVGGVEIGQGAFVAAGAVVTKNVPPGVLVAGVPARVVGPAPTWK